MTDMVYGPSDWRELTYAPAPVMPVKVPRCAAIKNNGEDCKLDAIAGAMFCRFHGGTTHAVQEQTRRRLDAVRSEMFEQLVAAAGEAVSTYIEIMRNGKKESDRLRAADRVLELIGVRDQVVEVHVKTSTEPTDIERELLTLLTEVAGDRLNEVIDVVSSEVSIGPDR
jgi:hypothetical protein